MSARDAILKAPKFKAEPVHVDEWGCDVEVRSVDLAARNKLLTRLKEMEAESSIVAAYPLVVIATAHDPETGERLFADDEVDVVNGLDPAATDKVANVALRLLGFTQADLNDPKDGS